MIRVQHPHPNPRRAKDLPVGTVFRLNGDDRDRVVRIRLDGGHVRIDFNGAGDVQCTATVGPESLAHTQKSVVHEGGTLKIVRYG